MRPVPFVAGVFVLLSVPACAGAAVAAYAAADSTYGVLVPRPGPSAVLLRGLFAVWGALLFCWLVEVAVGAAGRIAGQPEGRKALLPDHQSAGGINSTCRVRAEASRSVLVGAMTSVTGPLTMADHGGPGPLATARRYGLL